MTTFTRVLGGVASLALAGALAAGGPVFAQSLSQSSPLEMAQTMTLNAQEAEQGAMLVASNDAALSSNQSAYNQAQMQFDQAQARYRQQVDDYNKELKDYHANNTPPPVVTTRPPDVVVANPAPVVIARGRDYVINDPFYQRITILPDSALVRLGSLREPDVDIAGAPVEDRLGHAVGHFRHMTYVDEGKEEAVIVLNNNKMIALPEDHFRFDTDHSVVVADLSYDELNRSQARF